MRNKSRSSLHDRIIYLYYVQVIVFPEFNPLLDLLQPGDDNMRSAWKTEAKTEKFFSINYKRPALYATAISYINVMGNYYPTLVVIAV